MEQEKGCGLGCGLLVVGAGVVLIFLIPFVGPAIGMTLLVIAAIAGALLWRRRGDDGDEASGAGEDAPAEDGGG
ncbi:MAG: hypothetical protein D6696_01670 [Acidobacteria bacterium]|nr:MAG: hypothetical protein D6696_01670 [Acidobacteriota bacterium]